MRLREAAFTMISLRLWATPMGVAFFVLFAGISLAPLLAAASVIVNDVTQLNPVSVDRIETPKSTEDVQRLIKAHSGAISIGGGRFSMGGQIASEGTLHLDLRSMDQILELDTKNKTLRVQAGATWRKILERIDSENLSVQVMQSYSNFTVGGSLSVNAHGRYVGKGPIASTVLDLKIVTADGQVHMASPTQNPELFWGSLGGYGALGVITEARLQLADNSRLSRSAKDVSLKDYPDFFKTQILSNPKAILHNAELYPPLYKKLLAITWTETELPVTQAERLMPNAGKQLKNQLQLYALSEMPLAKDIRATWVTPNDLKKKAVVWRNFEAARNIESLEPPSRKRTTFALQEYFVPEEKFQEFTGEMIRILKKNKANVLNLSVRHTLKDPGTTMSWARTNVFSFVIYYKQSVSKKAQDQVGNWTRELIDAVLKAEGNYYLPYQLHATPKQFLRAYPQAIEFVLLKKKWDPQNRFRNKMWDKYLVSGNGL